jgi:hypothetical protein
VLPWLLQVVEQSRVRIRPDRAGFVVHPPILGLAVASRVPEVSPDAELLALQLPARVFQRWTGKWAAMQSAIADIGAGEVGPRGVRCGMLERRKF